MRRFAVLALCALASATGLQARERASAPATFGPEAGASAFKVALLTPGSIRDGGWNQSAYEGLEKIKTELGAEIAYQETKTPQDFEAGFRDFAARGFKLVFGHGFEFQDAAAKVAGEYPRHGVRHDQRLDRAPERGADRVRARGGHLRARLLRRAALEVAACSARWAA